jgi:predicted ATPase
LWKAWARIHSGWALAERARPDALAELEAGLDETRRIGAGRFEAFHLGLAAEVRSRNGQHAAAKSAVAAAFDALGRNPDMPFLSELYRLRAAVTLRTSAAAIHQAAADLQQALDVARAQGARSLELRAARDLAKLWVERRERQRARDLLAPVCDWFGEGFETPDLKDAKELLDQL